MDNKLHIFLTALFALVIPFILGTEGLTTQKPIPEADSSREVESVIVRGLRNDYRTGLSQILTFFNYTNLVLRHLVTKVSNLESHQQLQYRKNSSVEENFGNQLQQLQSDLINNTLRLLIKNKLTTGISFGGKSLEEISLGITGPYTLVIQITNHLDVSLSSYKQQLTLGKAVLPAPTVITGLTKEVFTFESTTGENKGTFLYRVGTTDFALQVFFACQSVSRRLAIAFSKNFVNPQTIYEATSGTNVPANPAAFSATNSYVTTNTALSITESYLHAQANFISSISQKFILSIDLFPDTLLNI